MIARLLRLLLLIQLVAGSAVGALAIAVAGLGPAGGCLAGLAAVLLARAAICANNFVLARRYAPDAARAHRLAPWRRAALFLREFHASMLSSSWTMAFGRPVQYRAPAGGGVPVLLVHGYGCNGGYWRALGRALRRAGVSHRAVTLEPPLAPIDDLARALAPAVEDWCRATGSERVILVGHSMGGLVARAYMRQAGLGRVAHCITLGSPHHGTGLACHGVGANCREMRWDRRRGPSDWLRALERDEAPAARARITSIYTLHDNIVAPQASSVLAGARNLPVAGIGHVALALHPDVIALVLRTVAAVGMVR